jgi:hypothetical protein
MTVQWVPCGRTHTVKLCAVGACNSFTDHGQVLGWPYCHRHAPLRRAVTLCQVLVTHFTRSTHAGVTASRHANVAGDVHEHHARVDVAVAA